MSKFVKSLSLFVAGLQLISSKASNTPTTNIERTDSNLKPVSLRPLNYNFDNLFAGHSSHSSHRSHASHASHYSGSGGYSAPYVATPTPSRISEPTGPVSVSPPQITNEKSLPANSSSSNSTDMVPLNVPAEFGANRTSGVEMTHTEKLRLQVIRVQVRLNSLGLYNGKISGQFDGETRAALRLFQQVKNLPMNGLMTTPTMNALSIPAVN
jgi:His-Xaa-Ser repeat protein HxsA